MQNSAGSYFSLTLIHIGIFGKWNCKGVEWHISHTLQLENHAQVHQSYVLCCSNKMLENFTCYKMNEDRLSVLYYFCLQIRCISSL